jgi:hypothetical protein
MDLFITMLDNLFNTNFIVSRDIDEDSIEYTDEAEEVIALACERLITDNGNPNWDNINKLKEYGYNVRRGDGDSFGWLTGIISKQNNDQILIFG